MSPKLLICGGLLFPLLWFLANIMQDDAGESNFLFALISFFLVMAISFILLNMGYKQNQRAMLLNAELDTPANRMWSYVALGACIVFSILILLSAIRPF